MLWNKSCSNVAIGSKLKAKGEDRATVKVLKNGTLYVGVFDGHNGASAARWCAENMDTLIESNYQRGKSTVAVLRDSFLQAHQSISDDSGTTASVVLIHQEYVAIAHVGDSRVVLCHHGSAVTVTEDHHVSWAVEHDRIVESERRLGESLIIGNRIDGLMVTRSIGDKSLSAEILAHPIVNEFLISKTDQYLVVATDGLWDVCDGQTAVNLLKQQQLRSPADMADALVYYASQQYNQKRIRADDITCSVIDLSIFQDAESSSANIA